MPKQLTEQRLIYKISTKRLKRAKWNLKLDFNMALELKEVVPLGDSELFRFIKDFGLSIKDMKGIFKKEIVAVDSANKTEFDRACKGFILNDMKYKRLVGTTGGVKKNIVLFASEDYLDDLRYKMDNGRNLEKELVPAKLEAYRALVCSTSTPVSLPKGILVVKDCLTRFKDKVIYVDDTLEERPTVTEIEDFEGELNASDGFGLCTPELMKRWAEDLQEDYIPSGMCIRNSFTKGMIYPIDIIKFAENIAKNYIIKDVWGNEHDIRNIELILTESMLKLWDSYNSIDHYLKCCEENGYSFSISKVAPHKLEDMRDLNYQYLQSYDLNDKAISDLVMPTVNWIKDAMCGDYNKTLEFLGVNEESKDKENVDFVQALIEDERMMQDPFVLMKVNKLIKNKIDNAKIGKLRCDGNYQIASGDPYLLLQSIFGLELTGLLGKGEFYSKYWIDKGSKEVLLFRSPMTSHNNIVKAKLISNDDVDEWYKYMNNIIIFNGWDTATIALNGEDFDSDVNFITDNEVLLKNYVPMPPIVCVQRKANKAVVTEEMLQQANKDGFGNDVGATTNRVTAMFEVQSFFNVDSDEWRELQYRITCGQLYQQNSIDKLKGVLTTPMDKAWYDYNACKTDFNKRVVAKNKPKFMQYIYPKDKMEYRKYIENCSRKCEIELGITIKELLSKEDLNEKEQIFLRYYNHKMPLGLGMCVMNKICEKVESEFEGYISEKRKADFDYGILKSEIKYTKKQYEQVKELYTEYNRRIREHAKTSKTVRIDKETSLLYRNMFRDEFKNKAEDIIKDKEKLCNIVLDICYPHSNSKQFAWDICHEQLISNLRRNKANDIDER